MTDPVFPRIEQFNQGRDPERLKLKYAAMSQNPFIFFRGSCHLFYEDWSVGSELDQAPLAWICGDLHLENFGDRPYVLRELLPSQDRLVLSSWGGKLRRPSRLCHRRRVDRFRPAG